MAKLIALEVRVARSWTECSEFPAQGSRGLTSTDAVFSADFSGGFFLLFSSMALNCISFQGSSTNNLQCKYIC